MLPLHIAHTIYACQHIGSAHMVLYSSNMLQWLCTHKRNHVFDCIQVTFVARLHFNPNITPWWSAFMWVQIYLYIYTCVSQIMPVHWWAPRIQWWLSWPRILKESADRQTENGGLPDGEFYLRSGYGLLFSRANQEHACLERLRRTEFQHQKATEIWFRQQNDHLHILIQRVPAKPLVKLPHTVWHRHIMAWQNVHPWWQSKLDHNMKRLSRRSTHLRTAPWACRNRNN